MEIKEKLNYSGIYCLRNKIDGRCYVGSAEKLNYRLWDHKHRLIKNNHANRYLQNFVNKYGIDNIYYEILEKVGLNNLIEREQYYMDTLKPEFNILLVAGSSKGVVMSQEQKDKISKNRKGILHTEETKKRISETLKGRPKTKEHTIKVGLKHKGKKISEEQRKKISESNKGRITTPKINWEIADKIRELHIKGVKDKEIAKLFNISNVQVNYIRNNKCWVRK